MKNSEVMLSKKEGKKQLSARELESVKSMKGKYSLREVGKIYGISKDSVARLWK